MDVAAALETRIRRLLERAPGAGATPQTPRPEADGPALDPARLAPVAARHLRWYVDQLVEPSYRPAVLERLVERWGLFFGAPDPHDLTGPMARLMRLAWHADRPKTWPMDVAPKDIATALERAPDRRARQLLDEFHRLRWSPPPDPR